jgi:hypothetical protein
MGRPPPEGTKVAFAPLPAAQGAAATATRGRPRRRRVLMLPTLRASEARAGMERGSMKLAGDTF